MTGRWFSSGTLVSSSNKADRRHIAEKLKVTLNTINQTGTHNIKTHNRTTQKPKKMRSLSASDRTPAVLLIYTVVKSSKSLGSDG